jgi:predicted Zn-dependent protease
VESLLETDKDQTPPGYYKKEDNFRFLRFKYRIMSQTMEPDQMRIFCSHRAEEGKTDLERIMGTYGLALAARTDRNYPRARQLLHKVIAAFPDRDILKVDLAVLDLESGRTDEARQLLTKAVRRDPTDMYAVFELARTLSAQREYDKARNLLDKVTKVMPDYSQLYWELARIEAGRNRDGASTFYLGKYYLYEGRVKQARQYLQRAARDTKLSDQLRQEAVTILKRLEELEKV